MNGDPRSGMSAGWKNPGTWVPLIFAGMMVWAFSGRYGPAQYFLQGFPGLGMIYAIIGLIRSTSRSHRLKAMLHGLLLVVAVAMLVRIEWSLDQAREFALKAARDIRAICLARGECPKRMEGWNWRSSQRHSQMLIEGPLLDWPLRYGGDDRSFVVELYIGLDAIEVWKGGLDAEIVKVR